MTDARLLYSIHDKTLLYASYQFVHNIFIALCCKNDNPRLFIGFRETGIRVKALPRGIPGPISSKPLIASA